MEGSQGLHPPTQFFLFDLDSFLFLVILLDMFQTKQERATLEVPGTHLKHCVSQ